MLSLSPGPPAGNVMIPELAMESQATDSLLAHSAYGKQHKKGKEDMCPFCGKLQKANIAKDSLCSGCGMDLKVRF